MARHPNSSSDFVIRGSDGTTLLIEAKRKRYRARVKVGNAFVYGDKASAAEVRQAVEFSAEALARMSKRISKPGVRLHSRRGIPLFSVDPDNPERIARKLNGKVEWGVFENGQFKVRG